MEVPDIDFLEAPQGDLRRNTNLPRTRVNKGLPLYEAKVVREPTASQRGKRRNERSELR